MLTDEEALTAALDRSSGLDQLHPNDAFGAGFHAALAWLRSQHVPLKAASGADQAVYNRMVQNYLAPRPAIPDGWQLVPKEISGEQWSAMRDEFSKYATRFEMAKTMCAADAIADVAPAEIYRAALAAAPEPSK